MDEFLVKFRSAIAELVAPLFSFEMKEGAWYGKQDLIELGLHMAAMNGYAEGTANALRSQSDVPTSETLLAYVKTLTRDEILSNAEGGIGRCVEKLKAKGLRLKDVALAFDWHDAPYYGEPIAGVVGTKRKHGTNFAFSFLTASVLTPKRRLVLCMIPLESRDGLPELVLGLLERIRSYVKGIAYVVFDNGFQDKELIDGLQLRKIPFILPSAIPRSSGAGGGGWDMQSASAIELMGSTSMSSKPWMQRDGNTSWQRTCQIPRSGCSASTRRGGA